MHTVDNPIFEAIFNAVGGRTSDAIDVLGALAALDGDDKLDVAKAYLVAKNFDPQAEYDAQEIEEHKAKIKRQEASKLRDKKVARWVLKNVDSGMIVKVSGTRDKGYRQVIRVDLTRLDYGAPWYMECRQLEVSVPVGCRRPKYPKFDQLKDRPYITEHLLKKVTAVLIDDEWKRVIDLMKETEND